MRGGPSEFILQQDPTDHTRLRKLMSQAFRPRTIATLRPRIEQLVDELLDAAVARGEMDIIADLALPVPATVICELMGVPVADRARFTEWTAAATHLLAVALTPPDVVERGLAGAQALADYFQALIEERRGRLGDDLLSDLIRAEEEGDRLSPSELISQSIGLMIAGFETTIGLIGNGMLAFIRHPEQLALLRADPSLAANAVDECLRFDGPILLTIRITREETHFGDRVVAADRPVMAMLSGANHDPTHFPDPGRFDIQRANADEHLAFGGGVHYCLGAHLARLEAQLAFAGVAQRLHGLELQESSLDWGRSLFRVLDRLPVRFAVH
jgi:hypothetical protein